MEEDLVDTVVETIPQKSYTERILLFTLLITTAFSFGCIHYYYVSTLFENDRNFSYLSNLERELSLRTEMGFYYSFYKTVVEEKPVLAALSQLMHDRMVEYPTEVNAFNRFNIHPEVMLGAAYQYLEPWLNTSTYRVCHIVDRGTLSPVESCTGIGEPIYFYLNSIWIMAGFVVAILFLHAVTLSESLLGGLLAVLQYFGNHEECTRVMWSPNERENLAMPLLLLQSWLLTLQLRDDKNKGALQLKVAIFIVNCFCLLFWQFTQFIFLTQIIIFFIMEQIHIIDVKNFCVILHSHFCGLHLAILILQGNEMLQASLYTSLFIVLSIYCLFLSNLRIKVQSPMDFIMEGLLVFLRIILAGCLSLYFKMILSEILNTTDDSHIFNLLYTKFSNYKNFHTLLYTCSDVFNFLPFSSIINMSKTLLLPFAFVSSINITIYWIKMALEKCNEYEKEATEYAKEGETEDTDSGIENNSEIKKEKKTKSVKIKKRTEQKFMCFVRCLKVDACIFYNISQMVVYGIMALLVMRLKLLFATQMCIVSSLLFKSNTFKLVCFCVLLGHLLDVAALYHITLAICSLIGDTVLHGYNICGPGVDDVKSALRFPKWLNKQIPSALLVLCIAVFLYNARLNILKELSILGEFNDPDQEELLNWIINSTSERSAFAGSMPILASVLLSARRPIVAHPHYENSGARKRAYTVYSVYGRFSSEDVYDSLNKLQATYFILEKKYCYGKSDRGCSFLDIWDIEHPKYASNPSLCKLLLRGDVNHFYPTFSNKEYTVFKLHDISVRYMPRSFGT